MRQSRPTPEAGGWLRPALLVVAAVVALRLLALALDRTDLFVDESQYWLWGQRLDFGYYSKPPLIGWLIRLVTDLAGSDSRFWVRMPGPLLHGATALLLGGLAARIGGAGAALWTAVLYITLPFTALGSYLITTDTVMAPFFAAALLFFWRAGEHRSPGMAALAGAAIGFAFLAKYAAVYFLLGIALTMAFVPCRRIGWRNGLILLAVFGLVIAPNVAWNLTHKLTTLSHTMDNAGWLREGAGANLAAVAGFVAAQFAVFGPVSFAALLWGNVHPGTAPRRALALLSLPPLVAVTVQAFLGEAQANWAVAAYFAGTVLAVLVLPGWGRWAALGVNAVAALAVPLLIVVAPWPVVDGKPVLKRYLGRADLSTRILALAQAEGLPVYAANRDILADLFHAGRDAGVRIYAPQPKGRARHYYEQNFALPAEYRGPLLVIAQAPLDCGAGPVPALADLKGTGVWAGKGFAPYRVEAVCIDAGN